MAQTEIGKIDGAKSKLRGEKIEKIRKEQKLIMPWIVESDMNDIPCIRIDE